MAKTLSEKDVREIIETGAIICRRIKVLKPHLDWPKIASLFTRVKIKAREYYPDLQDLELLQAIEKNFSQSDIGDVIDVSPHTARDHQPHIEAATHREAARAIAASGTLTHERPPYDLQSEAVHRAQINP